jgi:hypothetical protein
MCFIPPAIALVQHLWGSRILGYPATASQMSRKCYAARSRVGRSVDRVTRVTFSKVPVLTNCKKKDKCGNRKQSSFRNLYSIFSELYNGVTFYENECSMFDRQLNNITFEGLQELEP